MSVGYFIGLNDETKCGGKVLDGDPRINLYGVLHACEGDRVTCGVTGKTYQIVGGIPYMEPRQVDGRHPRQPQRLSMQIRTDSLGKNRDLHQ